MLTFGQLSATPLSDSVAGSGCAPTFALSFDRVLLTLKCVEETFDHQLDSVGSDGVGRVAIEVVATTVVPARSARVGVASGILDIAQ